MPPSTSPPQQPTSFQILSDLHLESVSPPYKLQVPISSSYLCLLGDIGLTTHPELFDFLNTQLINFKLVFFVPGNHEPYRSTWPEALSVLNTFAACNPRFILLTRIRYDLPNTNISVLGCTLFSHVPPKNQAAVAYRLNDFRLTGPEWTIDVHNSAHKLDLAWLNHTVNDIEGEGRQAVVFTHYSPTMLKEATDPRFRNSDIATAFGTDLSNESCWKSRVVKLWAFGHTHYNPTTEIKTLGGGRVVTNMRGYDWEVDKSFGLEKVWEVVFDGTLHIDPMEF